MFQFFYGPDRVPFAISDNHSIRCKEGIPFHGIISRGLLTDLSKQRILSQHWHLNAHKFFDDDFEVASKEGKRISKLIQKHEVLSFAHSTQVVKKYLTQHVGQDLIESENKSKISCWNIKEGHTSSVWRIDITSTAVTESFVLNVARDQMAGQELEALSIKLRALGVSEEELNLAKVHDVQTIHLEGLQHPVVVTKNQWIENSYEIHQRQSRSHDGQEWIMVERFLCSPRNPANIKSVIGRVFNSDEVKTIEKGIENFMQKATALLGARPQIEINDGDVVWDGNQAVIIAIS